MKLRHNMKSANNLEFLYHFSRKKLLINSTSILSVVFINSETIIIIYHPVDGREKI